MQLLLVLLNIQKHVCEPPNKEGNKNTRVKPYKIQGFEADTFVVTLLSKYNSLHFPPGICVWRTMALLHMS